MEGISDRSGVLEFTTHTARHLRLTDLARALNDKVLVPHGDELRTLLERLEPIVAGLTSDRGLLDSLITNVHAFVLDLPHNIVHQVVPRRHQPRTVNVDGTFRALHLDRCVPDLGM